jgi:squalene synthase HpnC
LSTATLPPVWPLDAAALNACRTVLGHGENFPVLSLLAPRPLAPHIMALYAYCRTVDDIGDEAAGDRLALLDAWEAGFRRAIVVGAPTPDPVLRAAAASARHLRLPLSPYLDLIQANRHDQRMREFATFADLRAYAQLSANPVGRLYLAIHGIHDPAAATLADEICTGLQMVNFLQDVAEDLYQRERVYLPQDELKHNEITRRDLAAGPAGPAWPRLRRLLAAQRRTARNLLDHGLALPERLSGRLAAAVWVFAQAGHMVLDALDHVDGNVWGHHPTPSARAKSALVARALLRLLRGAWRPARTPARNPV